MSEKKVTGSPKVKKGLAEMLKGGVIMDVVSAKHAAIAEKAGACAVMALEKVPADIRAHGGVARMADPARVREIMKMVSVPVMAKVRIGHFVEAMVLQELGVDFIDESEVLTPADERHHIEKSNFTVPFVCGAKNLGEALRRINEGAAMIRTKGEPGTGNIVEAVKHLRIISSELSSLKRLREDGLSDLAHRFRVPFDLVDQARKLGRIPVVNFAAGGVATPSDAALMMYLGADGIFVGSGIFKASNPLKMAKAIVDATTNFDNPKIIAKVSENLGMPMKGLEISTLGIRMQERGK